MATNRLPFLSRFTPGNSDPELLERVLVKHGKLVDQIQRDIADGAKNRSGHQWLLVGPRGSGKSHLMAVIYNRVIAKSALRRRLAIAYMKEEERGVSSYLVWIVQILRAFERRESDGQTLAAKIDELTTMRLDDAESAAERMLVEYVGGRMLVLLTENLDDVFSGLGAEGQKKFRDLIQRTQNWLVVATTQELFPAVSIEKAPFYGFFRTRHLDPLTEDESLGLVRALAAWDGRTQLCEELGTPEGIGRVRAIHAYTEGNPRLMVTFYQVIDLDTIGDIERVFLTMVEELTAYYQERMGSLTGSQQGIVEYLCKCGGASVPVKEIARNCFQTEQTVSKQLGLLANKRIVRSEKVGRESLYDLTEPLFRICFEIKANLGKPITLFVKFLSTYKTFQELEARYRISGSADFRPFIDQLIPSGSCGGKTQIELIRIFHILQFGRNRTHLHSAVAAGLRDVANRTKVPWVKLVVERVVEIATDESMSNLRKYPREQRPLLEMFAKGLLKYPEANDG
ncbi:MAG: hypothetical protein IT350_16705 [Deltaproteobacteria bacterium]|nr:hypothetical protein [Deltaproteobacteria bacterium]